MFAAKHGDDALIKEIKTEFTAKSISEHHRKLGIIPWKRIYTTNYDDVLEESYRANSRLITAVTTSYNPYKIPQGQTICIHLNGFVRRLDRSTINTELKLTDVSYLSVSLASSEWAAIFRQDIRLARAVFFVGYSLYDLDIRRLLVDTPLLQEKSFFVIGESPEDTTIRRVGRFGTGLKISGEEFASMMENKRHTYDPVVKSPLSTVSIRECVPSTHGSKVTDLALLHLFLFGMRNDKMITQSLRSSQPYFLQRKATDEVLKLIGDGLPIVVLCSDLGNGKSLCLEGLRFRAYEEGFRVFEVRQHNEEAISELEAISHHNGKVLVTIEEYQDWIDEIRMFRQNAAKDAVLVLTARNAVNDVVVDDLARASGLDSIQEISLDKLDDAEIDWFVDTFNEYGLWGELAGKERPIKARFLREKCEREIHAILLTLLDSPDISQRLRNLCHALKENESYYEMLISVCIMTTLNQMPTVDTLVDIWGTDILASSQFRKDPTVRQFLDIDKNEVLVKSPVAAQYLVANIADPAITLSVMTKMASQVDRLARGSERYRSMFGNLMRSTTVQLVLPPSKAGGGATIQYYESIKNLSHCKENPLFWLQYAIACLAINDLSRSKMYFATAYSLAERVASFDTYQIDNHFARFLLLQAIQELGPEEAMKSFSKARTIVNRQIMDKRRHYPYRVAAHYQKFLDRFGSELSVSQLTEIGEAAREVRSRIDELIPRRRKHKFVVGCERAMEDIMKRTAKLSGTKPVMDKKANA
jgi:hypothetical protein